jgi:putative SOS response-associated peptidase YedK
MCGRYSQTASLKDLQARFGFAAADVAELAPRYNIAPTQDAPVVMQEDARALRLLRWGLIPSWTRGSSIGSPLINARSETAAQNTSFRAAFRRQRCLVLADGFYEWPKAAGAGKIPTRIVLKSRAPFAMAGLWDVWKDPDSGNAWRTFAIVTAPSDGAMKAVHDRMPVILQNATDELIWLDPHAPPDVLAKIMAAPAPALETYAVSSAVNSSRNESPDCIKPA